VSTNVTLCIICFVAAIMYSLSWDFSTAAENSAAVIFGSERNDANSVARLFQRRVQCMLSLALQSASLRSVLERGS